MRIVGLETAEYRYPSQICNSKDRSLLVLKTQSSYSKENRLWRIRRDRKSRRGPTGDPLTRCDDGDIAD